jgi:FkbM family methyltransferase
MASKEGGGGSDIAAPTGLNRAEGDVDEIVRRTFFAGQKTGVIVDVGAARPDFLSISALYRSLGWRVIAIEPNPEFCRMHRELGYEVLQYACGDRDEDDVEFLVVDSHGAPYANGEVSFESFSSLGIKESYAALKDDLDTRTIQVQLRRLDTILATHAPDVREIDILAVDVEGWELEVLTGLDPRKYRPRVMIIENLFAEEEYRSSLKDLGYLFWRRIYPNDVFIARDQVWGLGPRWLRGLYGKLALRFIG